MEAISDLPMHNDMDADYSPQYVNSPVSSEPRSNPAISATKTTCRQLIWHDNMESPKGWFGKHSRCSPPTDTCIAQATSALIE
jgi:hypothetical protein